MAITNALKRWRIWESPKKHTRRLASSLVRGARGDGSISAGLEGGGGTYHDAKYVFHSLSGILAHQGGTSGVLEQRNAMANSSSRRIQRLAGTAGILGVLGLSCESPVGKSSDRNW